MTFAVEQEDGVYWLVTVRGDDHRRIAQFLSLEAAMSFTDVFNLAKLSAREVGRLGL